MARKTLHHCPQCDKDLPRDAFGNDKTRKDGRYRICKSCDKINQAAWRAKKAAAELAAKAAPAKATPAKKRAPRKAPVAS
jgi:hypothetical protein